MTSSPQSREAGDVSSEAHRVAGQVLSALAVTALAVATGAFGVMLGAYYLSGDHGLVRDWPDGIGGWVVCIPALLASATLAVAASRVQKPPAPQGPPRVSTWWGR